MARRYRQHGTGLSLGALLLAVVVVPATVLVLAVAAREGTTVQSGNAQRIPSLPAPATGAAAGETEAIELLPIVERPDDAAERGFFDSFAELDLADPDSVILALIEAWDQFEVGPVAELFAARALDLEVQNPRDTTELAALERDALAQLKTDPAHARHINDLAIGLFALGFATEDAFEPVGIFAGRWATRDASYRMLALGLEAFPDDRTLTINYGALASVAPEYAIVGDGLVDPVRTLGRWIDRHRDDVTARLLLAHLEGRGETDRDLDRALVTLEPLIRSKSDATVGHLARGDAMIAHAETRRTESPLLARRLARSALDEYDAAARDSGLADAYAGRALALDILGELDAATEAQRVALERDPGSAAWWLRLAVLEGCAGDETGRAASAARALEAIEASPARLGASRLIMADYSASVVVADRGFGGYSLGSGEMPLGVIWPSPEGTVILVDLDPFDAPPSCMPLDETEAQVSALEEAMLAALAQGDAATARSLFDGHSRGTEREQDARDMGTVADLLERITTDDDHVDALLAVQGRLDPAVAGPLCDAMLLTGTFSSSTLRTFEVGQGLGACIAESAWRAGNEEAAHDAMQRTIAMDEEGPVEGLRFLQAGMVAEAIGETAEARGAYRRAAADPGTIVAALVRLGDLTLTEGDPVAAIALYDLVLDVVDQGAGQDIYFPLSVPELRAAVQHVRSNRSVARLLVADAGRAEGVDCATDPGPCDLAQDDVAAALRSDPGSWVYQMNAAYVARLRGDDAAARDLLALALSGEPSTDWAIHNDLGVLDARRGARGEAREHLLLAIGSRPDYPLAPWNLGVLESSAGLPGFLAGQGWLAEAARLDRGFRRAPTEFRIDESIFRIELRRGRVADVTELVAPAGVAAAVFASAAAVSSLARLGGALVSPGREGAMSLTKRALVGRKPRLRTAGRLWHAARRLRIPWSSWIVWLPALVVLGLGTVYGAFRSAPDAVLGGVLIGAGTIILALVTHQAGHRLVSRATNTVVTPARWDAGLLTGIGALIFLAPTGPFPAEALGGPARGRVWLAALAGPIANCAGAAFAYLLWWIEPLPLLRALAITQLLVAAYFLLPAKPLDGSRLADHPVLTAVLGFGLAAVSAALAFGVL